MHDGDRDTGVKDPVITMGEDGYEMWLCCHPLDRPGHEDRMTTRRLTSADGLDWHDHGEVLAGREGHWDARGARVSAVLPDGTVLYDGRPAAVAPLAWTAALVVIARHELVPGLVHG